MIDAGDIDDLVLLVNIVSHAETLLHSLVEAVGHIGLYVNAKKKTLYVYNKK